MATDPSPTPTVDDAPSEALTDPPTKAPYLGAVGIGVSDLKRSIDFYTRVLGMTKLQKFTLPHMDEMIVGFEGRRGSAIALMHWTDGSEPTYRDLPIKIVLYVPDPVAAADAIRAEGLEIAREPTPIPELANAVVGLAKDPDGYVIELLQR